LSADKNEKSDQDLGMTSSGHSQKILDFIERVGNKIPTPCTLFAVLAVITLILSWIFDGAFVTYAGPDGKQVIAKCVSLINADGLRYIISSVIPNFVQFPPLGLVIVLMLAMGLAESTGLVNAFVRRLLMGVPSWAVTATIFIIGINCHVIASDAAMVFVPAAAAVVYAGMGRNPILGLSTAFAATAAGYSASLIPSGFDVLLSGITQSATGIISQTAKSPAHPLINYYFMSSSVIILTIVGTFVSEKIVAPRAERLWAKNLGETTSPELTPEEKKGLTYAGRTLLACVILLAILVVPENGVLRNPTTHTLMPSSPFLSGIVPIMFFLFLTTSVAFGIGKGVITKEPDVTRLIVQGLTPMLNFVVTAFTAAQFIAWFTKSNLATIIAVNGAEILKTLGLTGIPLVASYVVFSSAEDMLIMSGSAKWLFSSPIFVPMFGLLGFEPALTQAAYRIGASTANCITPLNYYIPVILSILARYVKTPDKAGMGTLLALQVPYFIAFEIFWTGWLILFMLLDWPLGPGAKIFL